MNKKYRNLYIDIIKSFLIITVVIGHTIVSFYPNEYIYNNIFKLIYSFHMFLFIFVSGYLVKLVGHNINFFWIKKRLLRLMVPYIVWTALILIIPGDFSLDNYLMLLIKPSYWFLIILFLYDVTYYILNKLTKKTNNQIKIVLFYTIISFFIWYISKNIIKSSEIFHLYVIYLPEYFVGIFAFSFKEKLIAVVKKYKYIILILYPISMMIYTYKDHSIFINTIQYILSYITIYNISNNLLNIISLFYNHYLIAPLGIIFWGLIIWKLYKLSIIGKRFALIGKYTLSIYLMSGFFNQDYVNFFEMDILLSILLGVFLPIIFEYITKKFPKIHYILFGTYK